ncbi:MULTISPECIES: hypothetical protein [unclassified Moorena]|uniref:hypothetical protein n=1 Tax=unclassified Moorena TaxID=2683338 RepID=UPI0013CAA6B2|nr:MULTISPECIES: hypothetical protein [unclassified Moorena]NEO21102.1 hypothetical protein [Moorena sp. SIO4A5]NEQ59683.1 hypothetical protein [Moorena sp. SIO4A1]
MTTLVFVHGTGVRQAAYEQTFRIVEGFVTKQRPDITVVPCCWGGEFGSKLNAKGVSIPPYDATLALDQGEEEDQTIILWQQLYRNPLYELGLLSLQPRTGGDSNPFGEQPGDQLNYRLLDLIPSGELQEKLESAGIAEGFDQARRHVTSSAVYQDVLNQVSDSDSDCYDTLARAIIAQAMFDSQQHHQNSIILPNRELRDQLVRSLSNALGKEEDLGLGDWLQKPLSLLARPATAWVMSKRAAITEANFPIPCDIMLYQGRGQKIRDFIQKTIEDAEPPVVILAHSLGGIACVDLLVTQSIKQVKLLITVGSQAPFLYEINALYSLEFGQPLPDFFPEWLNIYDLRDFLSYIGATLFPNKVQDVLVDSKQPFPQAHSAYWTNPATWKAIIPRLP